MTPAKIEVKKGDTMLFFTFDMGFCYNMLGDTQWNLFMIYESYCFALERSSI